MLYILQMLITASNHNWRFRKSVERSSRGLHKAAYCFKNHLHRRRGKTPIINLSQDRRWSGRNPNLAPPEYEYRALPKWCGIHPAISLTKSACVELYQLTNLPGRQNGENLQSAEEKLSHLRLAVDGIPDTAAIQSEFVHHTYTHCVAETERQLSVQETVCYGQHSVKTKGIRLPLIIRNFNAEKENKTAITENSLAFIVLCS